jgi:ubiquinol-cytochrome c reductase cytochrome c1 subunit
MKKLIAAFALAVAAGSAFGAGAALHLDKWPDRSKDLAALQNGARIFANYCLGCHSANLMRWNRLNDIGLDDRQIKDFLIFGPQKVGDTMSIAMNPKDAKLWFGKTPPDLSVIARARTSFEYTGADYLYTLLRGYYRDATSPTGWNNAVYPNIGMPHVLWELQGPREATIERVALGDKGLVRTTTTVDAEGRATVTSIPVTGHAEDGMTVSFRPLARELARQYDSDIADLVAYLVFMTEPVRTDRVRIGVWVLLFLALFTVVAWRLNAVYWKDVK